METTPSTADLPLTVIEPQTGWQSYSLRELWRYRELLYVLAWRDIQVRYKQTIIGAGWVVLQPLLTMLIFWTLFHLVAGEKMAEMTVSYSVVAFSGLILWRLFSNMLAAASESVIGNQNLVTKVYCPRLIFPLASIPVHLLDFCVALVMLFLMLAWYRIVPGVQILLLPVFVLLTVTTSLAFSLWIAGLNALYRDLRQLVPFVIQVWFYLSPIIYETRTLGLGRWKPLYSLNPLAGIVEGFRWSILGTEPPLWNMLFVSQAIVVALLVGGLFYFRRLERQFADWI